MSWGILFHLSAASISEDISHSPVAMPVNNSFCTIPRVITCSRILLTRDPALPIQDKSSNKYLRELHSSENFVHHKTGLLIGGQGVELLE